ncbi:MAG: type I toxin-antitoxin system SymE family toxin [bacterium]|nr:type I toxin-antitoxin system SymE family toxin [bacterium]
MNRNKKTRHLTIQTRYRKSRWMKLDKKKIPEIRISGIWLAEKGFIPRKK